MKKGLIWVLLCVLTITLHAKKTIRIACVGNSITFGLGLTDPSTESYPAVLQEMLGGDYEVRNFGVSSRTLLMKAEAPYMKHRAFQDALDFLPDIVTIKLGSNDSKPQNWIYGNEFERDLNTLIEAFQKLSSKPEVILCYPAPPTKIQFGINDSIIVNGIIPVIEKVAKKRKLRIIDLHTALLPYPHYFKDCVHPNAKGASFIACEIYEELKMK